MKVHYLDASALVKLVVDEGGHEDVRRFFRSHPNFAATSLCSAEALGAIKAKWMHGRISEGQYISATKQLIIDAWAKRIELNETSLFSPQGLSLVEALAKRYSLDLSDALQLDTIRRGKYSHFALGSASVLITADAKLASAAEAEGIRAWNCSVSCAEGDA